MSVLFGYAAHKTPNAPPQPELINSPDTATIPQQAQGHFAPAAMNTANDQQHIQTDRDAVCQAFVRHLIEREGYRTDVYKCTKGYLTVGIGHRVRARDNLQLGDSITDAQIQKFFINDVSAALEAAIGQAEMLGTENDNEFVMALTSVNYQLGSEWYKEHKRTWALMQSGQFAEAAVEAADSKWYKQTPVRVYDFQGALRALDAKMTQSYNISEYQKVKPRDVTPWSANGAQVLKLEAA